MTEKEWLTCTEPQAMLEFLQEKPSERKVRLFAVACCRRIWHLLTDQRSRSAVEVAERFADGKVNEIERLLAFEGAADAPSDATPALNHTPLDFSDGSRRAFAAYCASCTAGYTALNATAVAVPVRSLTRRAAEAVAYASFDPGDSTFAASDAAERSEKIGQANILRDVHGNPFRPPMIDSTWLAWENCTVLNVAQAIYDERAFDKMPILADALQSAGCDNAEMLNHLRQSGVHVKGCWVVDRLLGKE
jgi:hypothetical protein